MTEQEQRTRDIPGERFPPAVRLKRPADFESVFAGNRFAADTTLVVTATRNSGPTTRLGLSIGRQVGNAVVRNHWKRLIREAFRRNRHRLPSGLDIVVRPRKGAVAQWLHVERSLLALTRRIARELEQRQSTSRPAAKRSPRPEREPGQ